MAGIIVQGTSLDHPGLATPAWDFCSMAGLLLNPNRLLPPPWMDEPDAGSVSKELQVSMKCMSRTFGNAALVGMALAMVGCGGNGNGSRLQAGEVVGDAAAGVVAGAGGSWTAGTGGASAGGSEGRASGGSTGGAGRDTGGSVIGGSADVAYG